MRVFMIDNKTTRGMQSISRACSCCSSDFLDANVSTRIAPGVNTPTPTHSELQKYFGALGRWQGWWYRHAIRSRHAVTIGDTA